MTERHRPYDLSETHPGCRALREEGRRLEVADADNLPFYYRPTGATSAALLVHGFTATPWEMRPLAEFLADAGIASLAVRLPGHGTTLKDLAVRRWEEWADCIEDGYSLLNQDFKAIYGIGMSTGCLLLLKVARKLDLNGLVLFSPYLRMLHKMAPFAGLLRWVKPYQVKKIEENLQHRYYNRRPLASIHQINKLIKSVREDLPSITCPALAFNGEGDQTVDVGSSHGLMAALSSRVKIHEMYGPDVPHVLTREENPCRWSMFAQASRFIQEIEAPGEPSWVR